MYLAFRQGWVEEGSEYVLLGVYATEVLAEAAVAKAKQETGMFGYTSEYTVAQEVK